MVSSKMYRMEYSGQRAQTHPVLTQQQVSDGQFLLYGCGVIHSRRA